MVYAGLTPGVACTFTLHSLKCTVVLADRASQKYGRDDVVGQLRCQSSNLTDLSRVELWIVAEACPLILGQCLWRYASS